MALPKVCVIGVGSSGMPVVKALADRNIPFDAFEKSDEVGGNWLFKNSNGMSSAYRSLHINTSRDRMQYADLPMPRDYPDFPHHSLIAAYFRNYADHFDLRRRITFGTAVTHVRRSPDGTFLVTLETGEKRPYDAVVVANGHHWDPRWPEPSFPGHFDGIEMHSHHYVDPREPHDLEGKRVLVLGMGNSAMDIACELSRPGVAAKVFLAARRGAWIVPKYIFGQPLDQGTIPAWMPFALARAVGRWRLRRAVGDYTRYGLPAPDHDFLSAHPTISSDLLVRLGSGDITPKPNIAERMGERVKFADGSIEAVDAIVYCTGYKVTFPFFDENFIAAPGNDLPLWKRMVKPGLDNLFFVGLFQPLGAIMPAAERQAKLIAEHLRGRCGLPDEAQMRQEMAVERQVMFGRYVKSPRHTMQIDFDAYMADLAKVMREGRARARASGYHLPVAARVGGDSAVSGSRAA